MTKFRSKLKRNAGGKKVDKGQSSISNPQINKHRSKAQGRFFHTNMGSSNSNNGLTMEAMQKHDAIQSFNLKSLTGSLNDISVADDDGFSQSHRAMSQATTFATQFSATSNMSFNKLLVNFQPNSQIHKEMLAILAALTEIIKEKGGSETNTEYFLALMETIENVKADTELQAALTLLNMGIKSVSQAVLRKKFNETAEVLLNLFARFAESEGSVLKSVITSMSVVLRAQEFSSWKLSSTMKFFDAILTFTTHTKPKIRKAAQQAIASILFGSCFMLPPKTDDEENNENVEFSKIIHPAAHRVSLFCIDKFKPEIINNNQTLLLHVLAMLQGVLPCFHRDDIKIICEHLLSIMTSGNILIRTNCFQTFHSLFSSKSQNLTPQLVGRLITALYEYRPDRSDFKQILAWITVMKTAHVKFFTLSPDTCTQALPQFVDICVNDLWLSDKVEVVAGTSNALKEILEECIKPLEDPPVFYFSSFKKIISILTKSLAAPFGSSSNHILVICGVLFEVVGKHCGEELEDALIILGQRYDEQSAQRVHIEHAIYAAISHVDTSRVLKCIPLTDPQGNMSVKRSWLLPLLREGLQNSSLEYFHSKIMKLAYDCYVKWQKFKESDKKAEAHIYELLTCQLWGLFPGFCRKPKDLQNFKLIARTLGDVLNKNPDLRPPVLDGFKEILSNLENDEDKAVLSKYSENYLTRFFNIYTAKPNTSYERETRTITFEVIQMYLKIAPKNILDKLFTNAMDQLNSKSPGSFVYDSLFDIVESLAMYQSCDKLKELYKSYIVTTLTGKKKDSDDGDQKKDMNIRRRLKKAYKLLVDLLTSDTEGCIDFVAAELNNIEKILLSSAYKVIEGTQVMRLACLNHILEKKQENIEAGSKIVKISISEALAGFSNEAVVKDGIAYNLIRTVGKICNDHEKLNEFIDNVMVGLTGNDHQLIANTIYALKFILQEFGEHMSVDTLKFMLDQVLEFLVSNQRNEATASLYFIATFVKLLPVAFVANHLGLIMKAISLMSDDCRRNSRQVVTYLLKKLCKRFTPEEITKLVPGTDEVLHKKLKVIRKQMAKSKRNQMEQMRNKKKGEEDSDDDDILNIEKKSITIDDILADSDSDMSIDEVESNNKKSKKEKKQKKDQETYIRESEDTIVDLADPNAFSKITTSKANNQTIQVTKSKDPNRGFKTAPDGRLIINDIESDATDSDDDDLTGYKENPQKEHEESSGDENEEGPSTKKKIALNPYKTGGSGIHRPLAASVKSGMSNISKASRFSKASTKVPGSEYKGKKASGDVKKKGKHEPYAYIQLTRNSLNRRKRKAASNQFKGVANKGKKQKGKK